MVRASLGLESLRTARVGLPTLTTRQRLARYCAACKSLVTMPYVHKTFA